MRRLKVDSSRPENLVISITNALAHYPVLLRLWFDCGNVCWENGRISHVTDTSPAANSAIDLVSKTTTALTCR